MAKIIAWLIVIFVVMLALRIASMRNARARRAAERAQASGGNRGGVEPMVRCVRCGVYLPRGEAQAVRGGYACIGEKCAAHA